MTSLRVQRLRARVRGAAAVAPVEATMRRVLDAALELAVERAGVHEHEIVCIAALRAPARVDLRATDPHVAAELGEAIGAAMAEAIQRGLGVVRYGSREHALVDLACGVAAGDLGRAWAWRAAGVWKAEAGITPARAIEEWARAMVATPRAVVPALQAVSRRGLLAALARRAPPPIWLAIIRAVLAAYGADGARVPLTREPGPMASAPASWTARAARIAQRSVIGGALEPDEASFVRAVFAVLEAEPALLARPEDDLRPLLWAIDDALPSVRETDAPPIAPPRRPSASSPLLGRQSTPATAHVAERASLALRDAASSRRDAAPDDQPPLPDVRRRAATRYGGVLFLLHVLVELDLARELVVHTPLAERPLAFTLHALAMTLVPARPDDPATLAFAGLAPDAIPPSHGAEPPTADERSALDRVARRVAERARERMGLEDEPVASVLSSLCLRDAEIVAEPGWLEVRLSLDDVRTTVRKAGLDLDPGWLPWLGTVVRFLYE